MIYAFIAIFLAIPILSIVWSISNFIKYQKAKINHKSDNSSHSKEEIRSLKIMSVISFIVAWVLTGVVVGTIITFAVGISHM